ncbi:hypothetical protein KAR48_11305 [bacterium]|nr:hypothetical protein [bacterium]
MKKSIILLFLAAFVLGGCNTSINKSVYVEDGERRRSGLTSINGNVTIGDECVIRGTCRSVNGTIRIGWNSKTGGLQAVNGSITVGKETNINGSIRSVNGSVRCSRDVTIRGDINSVNGDIKITATRVEEDIVTRNGDIDILDGSEVDGDIRIKRRKGSKNFKHITIHISGNSIVHGDIINEDRHTDVSVILKEGGRINGITKNVELIKR